MALDDPIGSGDSDPGGPQGGRARRWLSDVDCDDGCNGLSDGCDAFGNLGDCDCGGCDLFLTFSSLVMLGSVLARVGGAVQRRTPMRDRPSGVRLTALALIAVRAYRRWLSARLPTRCRYIPSCSAYGLAAIEGYGLEVGGRMAAERIRRCRSDVPRGTIDLLEDHAASPTPLH